MKKRQFYFLMDKTNLYLFAASCVSQIFLWSINPEIFDLYKYILCAASFVLIVVLLFRLWKTSAAEERKQITIRILIFTILFNLVISLMARFLGGIASFLVGAVILFVFLRSQKVESI